MSPTIGGARHTVGPWTAAPPSWPPWPSAAVPGLDPVSVEALPEHRRPELRRRLRAGRRAPALGGAGAANRRGRRRDGPHGRPARPARATAAVRGAGPKGFVALAEGGRAAVYPYLPGHNLDYRRAARPGPGIAAELGRAIAALHNANPAVYEEAGLPSYDADAYRSRRLADLDRAAETGRVPTTLLTRWETGPRGRHAVAVRPHGDPRRPHRRPGARGVHRRRRRLDRRRCGRSPGGRTPRWPTRPTTSPRSGRRRPTRGGRDGARGVLAHPGRASRPEPARAGPARRRATACSAR